MDNLDTIRQQLQSFGPELTDALLNVSEIKEVPAGTDLLHEGQYVKWLPIVVDGSVRVFTRKEDKEMLLYHIEPSESCIMSFSAVMRDDYSRIHAQTERPSTLLLTPAREVPKLLDQYPQLGSLFFKLFHSRYVDLLDTINQLIFEKLDQRLILFLQEHVKRSGSNIVALSHRQIAMELGSAREVITRLMKRLETDGLIRNHDKGLEFLGSV